MRGGRSPKSPSSCWWARLRLDWTPCRLRRQDERSRRSLVVPPQAARRTVQAKPGGLSGLKALLRSPTIASKRWVWEQYDHTVQTNTVIGPGAHDAALLRVKGERFGIALTMGGQRAVLSA
jgi:phosphoribosylformylglycinamidine (FGAM) synthase-like enzyme